MKKILIAGIIASFVFTPTAFAETDIPVPVAPTLSSVSVTLEKEENIPVTPKKEEVAKKRANKLIDERIKALQENKSAIESNKKLTQDQKTTLSAALLVNINNLGALKSTISSSTDATTTKSLIESIFKEYRIYAIVIPKARLESRVYQLKNHSNTLSEVFSKMQIRIDENKAKGNDVTSWQKGLDDAKVIVAQDMFKLEELLKKTQTLTPASYGTTSKAVIESVNQEIKAVSKDFNSVVGKVRKPEVMKKRLLDKTPIGAGATTTVR